MSESDEDRSGPQFHAAPLITSAVMVGGAP